MWNVCLVPTLLNVWDCWVWCLHMLHLLSHLKLPLGLFSCGGWMSGVFDCMRICRRLHASAFVQIPHLSFEPFSEMRVMWSKNAKLTESSSWWSLGAPPLRRKEMEKKKKKVSVHHFCTFGLLRFEILAKWHRGKPAPCSVNGEHVHFWWKVWVQVPTGANTTRATGMDWEMTLSLH